MNTQIKVKNSSIKICTQINLTQNPPQFHQILIKSPNFLIVPLLFSSRISQIYNNLTVKKNTNIISFYDFLYNFHSRSFDDIPHEPPQECSHFQQDKLPTECKIEMRKYGYKVSSPSSSRIFYTLCFLMTMSTYIRIMFLHFQLSFLLSYFPPYICSILIMLK